MRVLLLRALGVTRFGGDDCALLSSSSSSRASWTVWPSDALYVLSTSGTSGSPRAVVGSAKATERRLAWGWRRFPHCAEERVLRRTPIFFVDSIAEVFGALLGGAARPFPRPSQSLSEEERPFSKFACL